MDNLPVEEKNNSLVSQEQRQAFRNDTKLLSKHTVDYIENFYPAYSINPLEIQNIQKENSLDLLNKFTFYHLCECSVEDVNDLFAVFSSKMQKLFITAYSIKQEVCYGIVSNDGQTSLVVGISPSSKDEAIKRIIEGILPGMKIEKYEKKFINSQKECQNRNEHFDKDRYVGCISGIPALKVNGQLIEKDLSSLMRSLNGENYTIMVMCKPMEEHVIQDRINQAIKIQDDCFAISKRTISLQRGTSNSTSHTNNVSEMNGENKSKGKGKNLSGAIPGMIAGATTGAVLGTPIPIIGNAVGIVAGGLVGLIAGQQLNFNKNSSSGKSHSITEGYSDAVTQAVNEGESLSLDIQNGFAIELMKMAETMTDRLKVGRSIGMWETVISYSSDSEMASRIIQGSLYSEIASGIPEILPPVVFSYKDTCGSNKKKIHNDQLLIPAGFFRGNNKSPLCSFVTSEELCGICTIPTDNTVGFEIKKAKSYSINNQKNDDDILIGEICEYERPLPNVQFGLSEEDLNKHTFVCGITGYGKTNTIKRILENIQKPFMVIEPAKKEYRSIKGVEVYTFGRPEINCLKINPFYIMPGISPQQHIDLLKDLFCASFALYGPMPYIVEKCLYNIYAKKGWNLTLGFHPCLTGANQAMDLFNEDAINQKYSMISHCFYFPTMQDLKDEVDYYIDHEMTYEGEVKGNIKSAIKARIDSLCVGAKGYMFNTYETTKFDDLFNKNVVFELEGLADDADKAFALGLLIIYVNEYRQVRKEITQNHKKGLQHILVIEEAHRLLKNVSTERNNEDIGNPKGKAVEHFTNMLAEMRSYGQGVIIAEQIPSKLAPDVIKNSSNKIVHRLVALDDQEIVASTIGVNTREAIYLGNLKTGYALCHKEGMIQPVITKVREITKKTVTDDNLYQKNVDNKLLEINKSIISNELSQEIESWAVKTLISIMLQHDYRRIYDGLVIATDNIKRKANLKAIAMIPGVDKNKCILECIANNICVMLVSGVFSSNQMPSNEMITCINKTIKVPDDKKLEKLNNMLKTFYKRNPNSKAIDIVAGLASKEYAEGADITNFVNDFMLINDEKFVSDVKNKLSRTEA